MTQGSLGRKRFLGDFLDGTLSHLNDLAELPVKIATPGKPSQWSTSEGTITQSYLHMDTMVK
jgi:hypothetical protein